VVNALKNIAIGIVIFIVADQLIDALINRINMNILDNNEQGANIGSEGKVIQCGKCTEKYSHRASGLYRG